MSLKTPDPQELQRIIKMALAEDIGAGDVTSQLTIPDTTQAVMRFVVREQMMVCGLFIPQAVYAELGGEVVCEMGVRDGMLVQPGTVLMVVQGPATLLLKGERVALNLMQRMCGIATLTYIYVQAVSGLKAVILDTRKTMPGLRALDKYAVAVGGGKNHRMRLDDMVMIKDNHIAVCGGITQAVQKARAGTQLPIEVECDTLEQVKEALAVKPDRILLDNMSLEELKQAVALVAGAIPLEASGNVSLETVRAIAQTGVDYISIGKLTHSAKSADIGADVVL